MLIGLSRWRQPDMGKSLITLIVAASLAIGVTAIQILPTLEFTSLSGRASPDIPAETVAFSLHPARLAETVWSAAWGSMLPQNSRWFPWAQAERSIWVPNLYAGLVPLLLALASFRIRRGAAIDRWLTSVTLVSLLLAFGKFGDFRWIWDVGAFNALDPLDVERGTRLHGDAAGLYWLAEETIPGFKQFRYPSKLLVFVFWGLAMLAGRGLARWTDDPSDRRTWRLTGFAAVLLLLASLAAPLASMPLREFIQKNATPASGYGPFQLDLAMSHLFISLTAGMVIGGLFLLLLITLRLRPFALAYGPSCVLGIVILDLLIAHRSICLTAPQAELDVVPASIEKIREYHKQIIQANSFESIGRDCTNRSSSSETPPPNESPSRSSGNG